MVPSALLLPSEAMLLAAEVAGPVFGLHPELSVPRVVLERFAQAGIIGLFRIGRVRNGTGGLQGVIICGSRISAWNTFGFQREKPETPLFSQSLKRDEFRTPWLTWADSCL